MLAVDAFLDADRRLADFRLLVQAGFDFPQFDAVTANFHLMVDPADVLQHAVAAPTRQVAGAIQPLARRAERIGHEYLGRAQRIADITTTDTGTGHAQLTHRAQRHQFIGPREQVQTVVVGRRADRQVAAAGRGQVDAEERHVVRAFRRAIGVDQADLWITQQPLVRQLRRHRLAGRQHPAQAVEADPFLGQHALDQRRHALQHRDPLLPDMGQQALRVMGDGIRHDIHTGPEQRCGEELPDRNIEALRGRLGNHIGFVQCQVRHLAQLVVEHAALLDHHPLGQTGGTGGVDHVREVVRRTLDSRVGQRVGTLLDLFPHQQLRARAAQFVKQRRGLGTARGSADQHGRAAQLDDPAQALARQARVQRQVAGAGLEAADDHRQQVEAALGQQGHRLVETDTGRDQGMAQAVAALVQLLIAVLPVQAGRDDPLRMRGHPCLEQCRVTLFQRIVTGTLVAAFEQEIAFFGAEQRQLIHVAMETLHQRQQQALELAQQTLDAARLEVTLVIGQVQSQVIARITDRGQREVGMSAARIRGRIEALRPVQHRDFHRGVLEHEQAVEQRLTLGQFAVFLDRHQRQILVLAQLHIAFEQAAEPTAHAAAGAVFRQFHPQRDTVDEQPDGTLHLRHLHRTTGHGDPEQHIAITAETAQDQGPGRLGEGVDGQLVLLRQFPQPRAVTGVETGVAVAHHHAAAFPGMLTQERPVAGDMGGAFEALQVVFPPLLRRGQVLPLQPADIVAVARRHGQLRFTPFAEGGVDLEEIVHQQRAAPGIDQDVVVAHHEPVACRADLDQAQVERRLAQQIETGLALALEQALQTGLLLVLGPGAPVQVFDRRAARLVDNLQHVLADVPAERRTQGFMASDHRLPGLGETLRIELAVDPVAVLHVVQAGARLQQGVQQQALLHRGQRIDVLDLAGGHRQRIELPLGQARQREVRGRQAAGIVAQAMLDQAAQFAQVGVRQLGNGAAVETLATEGPAQYQLTAIDLAVDAQFVGQRRLGRMGLARRLFQRTEQRLVAEALVELAEVVEGDRRHRQGRHGRAQRRFGQVAQHAMAQALVRYPAQLLLDGLDRVALPRGFLDIQRGQAHRIGAGEPADGAGQVDLVEQGFPAVAFQLHQRRRLPGPAADHPRQGGQQQVVDLGAVGARSLLQQGTGPGRIETDAEGFGMTILPPALRTLAGQFEVRSGQLRLPARQLFAQRFAAGIGLQAVRPVTQGTGLRRQLRRLTGQQLTVGGLQVVQQDAPGHPVHHQVMNRQQQALFALRPVHQQGPEQRPLLQVEAALGLAEQGRALRHRRDAHLLQQRRHVRRPVFGSPVARFAGKTQAQGVVMDQQCRQGLLQRVGLEGPHRCQDQRLVPVLALGNLAVEEPVLDRCQAAGTAEQALLGADPLAAGCHRRQALHGLVLEQVAGAEVNTQLAGPADHLDRQDRVAPQFEEIIVEPDLADVQYFTPDPGQALLQLVARRHIVLAVELRVRRRQGTPVELAIGGQRHARQQDQVGGHHVVRQLAFQVCLERFTQFDLPLFLPGRHIADQVSGQLLATGGIQRQDHGLANRRVVQQAGFDFPQFDAETADLHLMVDAPEVFHQAVGALADQVAGAVQAGAIAGKRIGDKTLGGDSRTLVITLGQAGAADIQLAGGALRHQGQVGIEDIGHTGTDHPADRDAGRALFQLFGCQAGQWHDHGFGRAIGVEEQVRLEGRANPLQVLAGQRFAAGDAHAYRQGLRLGRQPLGQLAAVARGKTEDIDLLLTDQLADFLGIPLPLGPQHHPGAAQQRHQQTLGGGVEVDRIEMQFAVIGLHVEAADHRLAMHGDLTVGDHHALGLAGGTGGVDQVRLVLGQADKRQLVARVPGQGRTVLLQAPLRDTRRQRTQGLEQRGIAQEQADAAVFDHVVEAIQRVFRVQRHVGAAGLENRQQADNHFQRPLQCQADPHLRAHALLAQAPGQAIGPGIEFGIAQGLAGKGQCRRLWPGFGLLAEQAVDALVEPLFAVFRPQAGKQRLLFVGLQQRQLAQALPLIADQGLQQVAPVSGHARDARFVEQVGTVGQAATQAVVEVGDFQVEVELGRPGIVDQVFDFHPTQAAALLELPALDVAHHLEQRVVGGAARRLQGFHQMIERQVLMGLAFDHGVAYLLEQRLDTHLPVELAAQHLGIEEGADQALAFRPDPVGHRRADTQVGLAAVAIEQHGQRGGHGHEQGQAMLRVERPDPCRQLVAEVEAVQLATMTLYRGPWAVARQFEQRMFVAQLRGPVVQLALALAGLQPLALPDAVVEVLHRQRRQRRLAPVDKRLVERTQFAGEDIHRPAFGDDVVQGQDKVMLLLPGLDQAGPQQRPAFQVERQVRFAVGQLLHTLLARLAIKGREILPGQADTGLGGHPLVGHAIDAREGGTQGFMAQDQRLQRGLETGHIEHAGKPSHAADVIGRTVRLHLPEEPHALLGIGQRHQLAAVDGADRRLRVAPAGQLDQADLLGERAQFRGLEQHPQRQLDIAGLAGAGNDLGRQQRMAAEGKEIIAQADAWLAQHFTPDRGNLLLQRRARLDMLAHLPLRLGQGLAVQLAAGAQGHGVQAHQLRRHHVFRQLRRQGGLEQGSLDVIGLRRLGTGVVAYQLPAGSGLAHQHHRLGDTVQGQQARFDFLRLDPEATQLDLLVQATEVFQHTIGTPANTVTGAVQAFARRPQRIGDKTLGGQPGTSQVTTGQTDATDAQFTRHAAGQRVQVGVEDPT